MHLSPSLYVPILAYVLLVSTRVAQCQDFNVPTSWRKPTSALSLTERVSLAQNAGSSLANLINPSNGTNYALNTWQSANVLGSIAQLDYVSGSQNNHDLVRQSIAAFQSSHPAFFDSQVPRNVTSDPLMWGLSAFYGSRAYNDTNLLNTAIFIWSSVQTYVVNAQDAASGTHPTKNGTFSPSCLSNANYTSAGAVFWKATTLDDYTSNAETVGAYVALSAHLWEATSNATYLKSAEQSALFMYTYLYSNTAQIIQDTFDLKACTASQLQWTYNQGFLMEGLSILSTAPIVTDSTWESLLKILVGSTIPFPAWTSPNGTNAGVLIEGQVNFGSKAEYSAFQLQKDVFIGALLEIWSRIPSSDPMATFIEAFMNVQFNALQDLASNHNTYSPVWTGPQLPQIVPWGRLAAMPVLSAAVRMAPNSSSNANGSTTTTSTPSSPASSSSSAPREPSPSRSLPGGAIAGIVIGVVGGIILVIASVVLARRHKKRLATEEKERQDSVQPFVGSTAHRPPIGTGRTVENLPVGHARKERDGYGSGQVYVGSPLLSVPESVEPVTASVSVGRTPTSEGFLHELIEQVMDRIVRGHEEPPPYTGQ
ncbi:hypothetical protein PENSPDRAFT_753335 [Peniophora sp. CONT]|nr:hypothetical protein PENSPDRAFT_753335 [Peniophora sp. CONT]